MYLETNGAKYPNVRRYASGESISYTGASLVDVAELGTVNVYRDDGFLLMTDDAAQYPYQTITKTMTVRARACMHRRLRS